MKVEQKCPECGRTRMINRTGTYHPGFTGRCMKCANGKNQTGESNPGWKGGRIITSKGYVMLRCPEHPRAKNNNGYVFEHILVIEEKLGRLLLPEERSHHLNGIKDDNRPGNLVLMEHGKHTVLHWTGRHHTEESKRKMSQAKIGKILSEEFREKQKMLAKTRLRDEITGRWLQCV